MWRPLSSYPLLCSDSTPSILTTSLFCPHFATLVSIRSIIARLLFSDSPLYPPLGPPVSTHPSLLSVNPTLLTPCSYITSLSLANRSCLFLSFIFTWPLASLTGERARGLKRSLLAKPSLFPGQNEGTYFWTSNWTYPLEHYSRPFIFPFFSRFHFSFLQTDSST